MIARLFRLVKAVALVLGGLAVGALAGSLRRRPVPPAVQAADPRPGQA